MLVLQILSGMAKDLSGMVSNPYANLGVATQAAEYTNRRSRYCFSKYIRYT